MTSLAGENSQNSTSMPGLDWLAEYPPPRSLPLDREALRIYEHAYALGLTVEQSGTPPITFSTVIAALLVGEDETSRWFIKQAAKYGPKEVNVFSNKGTDRDAVEGLLRPQGKPNPVQLSADKHLLTVSARSLLSCAEGWAQKVGGSDIGVRHLVAAYVINPPPAHRSQMQKWEFQEVQWRQPFFTWVAERYTAERWTDASQRPAPARAIPEVERVEVKGEALALKGDPSADFVLARAAELHARRPDQWLRLQTLWHALIDAAGNDTGIAAAIAPVWAAVTVAGPQYTRAFNDYFPPPPAAESKQTVAFDALDISPRVLNALETARELAVAIRKERMSVLHLAGALVSRGVDGDPEITSFGFQPRDLRLALINHAEAQGESADVWRDALGAEEAEESVQAGRPLDLNSDEPEAVVRVDEDWADDPLKIRRDVETFGALLASKSLEPPLSIGLFGPWGSGKTTFLKRLQRSVKRRAKEARDAIDAGKPTLYVRHVVHVDFNAWHFAEGALTSSLVDTILRELGRYITDGKPAAGEEWEKRKLDVLETTKRKVEAAKAVVTAASAAVITAEKTLTEKQEAAAKAATSLRSAAESVWSAIQKTFTESSDVKKSGVLEALGETITSAGELRARLESLRKRPARLLGDLGWVSTLVFAGLVLGVPLAVAWLSKSVLESHQAAQVLSVATAALSVIGVWARAATAAVAKVDKAVGEVADAYEKQIAEDEDVKKAQAGLAAAEASAATAASGLQAAQQELARARTDAASATLPAQMLQLLTSRIDSQSYSKELTTLSLARADLEAMSVLLRDQRSKPETPSANAGAGTVAPETVPAAAVRPVDRVILYIDDLDRCRPPDVVRVLQLVHMLLAFELFVVVVAVDARWVEECLRQSFHWLGGGETGKKTGIEADGADTSDGNSDQSFEPATSRISPQDYLEKIFQIAFWLAPMTKPQAADYLASLVRTQARESGPVIGAGASTEQPAGAGTTPVFTKVEIAAIELDYMRYLAGFAGSSPRRVKRLVNVYRLIKASLTDSQLKTFLTRFAKDEGGRPLSGPYQVVIGLLVIGTGAPASAARIFREVTACDPGEALDEVVKRFRERSHPDWTMAAQVIEVLMRTQKAKDVTELRNWVSKVGRFHLNSPYDFRLDETHRVRSS